MRSQRLEIRVEVDERLHHLRRHQFRFRRGVHLARKAVIAQHGQGRHSMNKIRMRCYRQDIARYFLGLFRDRLGVPFFLARRTQKPLVIGFGNHRLQFGAKTFVVVELAAHASFIHRPRRGGQARHGYGVGQHGHVALRDLFAVVKRVRVQERP